jgi:hypothetical protein
MMESLSRASGMRVNRLSSAGNVQAQHWVVAAEAGSEPCGGLVVIPELRVGRGEQTQWQEGQPADAVMARAEQPHEPSSRIDARRFCAEAMISQGAGEVAERLAGDVVGHTVVAVEVGQGVEARQQDMGPE